MGLQENFLLEVLSSVSWYNHHHHKDTRTTNDIFFKDKVVKIFKWLLWLIICFQDFLKAIDELNLYTLKIRFKRIWQKFIYDVMCDVICWLVSFLSTFFTGVLEGTCLQTSQKQTKSHIWLVSFSRNFMRRNVCQFIKKFFKNLYGE